MLLGGVHLERVHVGEELFAQFAPIAGALLLARLVMRLELLEVDGLEVARHALVDLGRLTGFLGQLRRDRCDCGVLAQLLLLWFVAARRVKDVCEAGVERIDVAIDGAHLSRDSHLIVDFGPVANLAITSERLAGVEALQFGGRLLLLLCFLWRWCRVLLLCGATGRRVVRCDAVLLVDQIQNVRLDSLQIVLESVHVIEQRHATLAHHVVDADDHHECVADHAANLVGHLGAGDGGQRVGERHTVGAGNQLVAHIAMLERRNGLVLADADRLVLVHLGLMVLLLLLYDAWLRRTGYTDRAARQQTVDFLGRVHLVLILLDLELLLRIIGSVHLELCNLGLIVV